jgi:acyl carrier protein
MARCIMSGSGVQHLAGFGILHEHACMAGGAEQMSVRSTITSQFEQVAKEQGKHLATLTDATPLLDSGLDSLCFAIIVARLEDELGLDPFTTSEDADFPVTFGDFVRFYENAGK